ncbi:MAG TPA: hypothetical protein VGB90_09645 [Alphaproteobacteria bacterium]|jgi:hypothetical protein
MSARLTARERAQVRRSIRVCIDMMSMQIRAQGDDAALRLAVRSVERVVRPFLEFWCLELLPHVRNAGADPEALTKALSDVDCVVLNMVANMTAQLVCARTEAAPEAQRDVVDAYNVLFARLLLRSTEVKRMAPAIHPFSGEMRHPGPAN